MGLNSEVFSSDELSLQVSTPSLVLLLSKLILELGENHEDYDLSLKLIKTTSASPDVQVCRLCMLQNSRFDRRCRVLTSHGAYAAVTEIQPGHNVLVMRHLLHE